MSDSLSGDLAPLLLVERRGCELGAGELVGLKGVLKVLFDVLFGELLELQFQGHEICDYYSQFMINESLA